MLFKRQHAAGGQTPQTCWVSTVENATGLPWYARPVRATEVAGGDLVLLSLQRALVAYSVPQRRVAWRFAWQPLTEVMADGDVFSYPIRQDGASPLALDEAAGLAYLGAGDRVLYALDLATGRPRWSWLSSQAFESVVAGGGRVFVSTEDYRQVGLDGASGQLAWQLQFRRLSSPQTGVFEDVMVRPDQNGGIWGINATTGKVLWLTYLPRRQAIVNFFDDMPYDPATGRVFISDDAGYLYAVQLRTGVLAWEADVASRQSIKRVANLAAARGRVFAVSSMNMVVEAAGVNGRAVAYNASTGEVLWERSGLGGSCSPGGMQVLPQRVVLLGMVSSWGGTVAPLQYVATDDATGANLWSLPMGVRTCSSPPQYLPGSDLLMLTTLSEDRTALELTFLPSALGATCPQRPDEGAAGTLTTPPAPPLAPPAPPPPPQGRTGPDYCWRAQLSQLPLADPATDGERVYAQDNRGMAIAADVRTGAVAWKSAACGSDSIWPGSPLVWGGVVYMICATSRVLALNATTGRLLWRTRAICQEPTVKPGRTCTGYGSYGHPALSPGLGLVYFGGPDRSYYAFNSTTGEEVWNYYEGNGMVTYSSGVGLHEGLLYAMMNTNSEDAMKLLALNATDGTLVWSRLADGGARDNGVLEFVHGTLAVGTSDGQLRLYSVGLDGGDVIWSMPVTNVPIYGVERDGDTLFFGDDGGWVRAVSISNTSVLWEVSTMDLPELEGVPIPFNEIEPRPVYSQGRLYVTCRAGLLVMDAATGAVLWAELSQRSLASPLVIERPEGAQVVIGQYLDKLVSISPNCNPTGRGENTLSFAASTAQLRVSLGLNGVSAKVLRADTKAQAAVAAAVDRVAGGSGVRVEVEAVSSSGGESSSSSSAGAVVVRLRVEVQGSSSRRVADVVAALEASVLEDRSASGGGGSKVHLSPMQSALVVSAGASGRQVLASARVRVLVVRAATF
ncbi:hypothetical protein HXX76_008045 [Chlamydomonas incerta]|uniref:Pyrrolo-quinoline quinone repeat domain-containing protein n=1 Tax=Chlamydomonas incerta TaxID=51695 RepID=A0A835SUY6_CHLIN|nr:hypothetical protein HXX76_008045 [Chlamydomonas incerta]|eukprot:KAG2433674.1 hypothetical protein HXX76_008045 [Chlamydomonas incerta]